MSIAKNIFQTLSGLGFLKVLPIEESYFKSFVFERKNKLSKEVIVLNYGEFSPYVHYDVVYKQEKAKIGVWFCDISLVHPVTIPESYVLAKVLKKINDSALFHFQGDINKIVILKEGAFVQQLYKKEFSQYEIMMLQKEYGIRDVCLYTQTDLERFREESLSFITLQDIVAFTNIKLDPKTVGKDIVQKISYPVALTVALLFGVEVVNKFYLQYALSDIEKHYKELHSNTQELQSELKEIQKMQEKFEGLDNELQSNSKVLKIIEVLSKEMEEKNATTVYVEVTPSTFKTTLETNQTSDLFSSLIGSGLFEDLKIISTTKAKMGREKTFLEGKINVKQ